LAQIFQAQRKNHFDNKANFRYPDDDSFRLKLDLIRQKVQSGASSHAQKEKS
jgi:hypothetical protein